MPSNMTIDIQQLLFFGKLNFSFMLNRSIGELRKVNTTSLIGWKRI